MTRESRDETYSAQGFVGSAACSSSGGSTYTLEVSREANNYMLEPASVEFTVARGIQTVLLNVQRAVGDVRAVFSTTHANTSHWSAPLKLPAPFEFRVLSKRLGVVALTGEVPRQPSHTVRQLLPARQSLFVGEAYILEVGFQVRALVATAADEIAKVFNAFAASDKSSAGRVDGHSSTLSLGEMFFMMKASAMRL